MGHIRTITRNVFSNWANLLVSLSISFFMAPFILHHIGNNYYGIWALISQVTGYFWLLDFGVRDSIVKYVAEFKEKDELGPMNDVISSAFRMYSVICLLCIIASITLSIFFPILFTISKEFLFVARLVVIIVGVDIAQSFVFNVFVGILMGLQRYDIFSKVSIVFSFIRALLTVIFLSKGYNILSLALIQIFVNLSTNIIIFIISKKMLDFKLWDKVNRKKHWFNSDIINYSFFVFLNTIGYQAALYTSNFIIAAFLPVASVTYYAIAGTLIDYMKKIIVSGNQVFSPLTSQLDAKNDDKSIRTLFLKGTKFSLIIGLPMTIIFIFMGKQFIGLWMGQAYSSITGNILAILAVMTALSLPFFTISSILFGIKKHNISGYCRIFQAIFTIGLSIILIKHYGLIGVAFGNAIPDMIITLFVLPIIIKKILGISFLEYIKISWVGPLIGCFPFGISCYFANIYYSSNDMIQFFSKVFLLLLIYLIGIWFGALTSEEKELLKSKISLI